MPKKPVSAKPQTAFRERKAGEFARTNRMQVGRLSGKSAQNPRAIRARRLFLKSLDAVPFMKELLEKKASIAVEHNGVHYSFTLLRTGIRFAGFERPVLIVLNSQGVAIPFYKSTGANSKMPGKWLPFRDIRYAEVEKGRKDWWYAKFKGHPNNPPVYEKLSGELTRIFNELERISRKQSSSRPLSIQESGFAEKYGITLKKDWDMDQLSAIKEYLGMPE